MLIGAFGAGLAVAQAPQWSYQGSAQFATGSYFFTESTQSFYLNNGLGWSGDRVSWSVSVPLVAQNSPWVSYSPTGQLPTGGSQHGALHDQSQGGSTPEAVMSTHYKMGSQGMGRGSRQEIELPDTVSYTKVGFSDPTAHMSLQVWKNSAYTTTVNINGTIKFPLTDPNDGFGTGQWDGGLGLSFMQRMGTFFLMGDAMYWWFGDLPDMELKDPIAYSIGVGKIFAYGKWLTNASFNGFTEIIDEYDPPMSVALGLGYQAQTRFSLNVNGSVGLSESAADLSLGVGWSIRF
jgi:hypothetical protein